MTEPSGSSVVSSVVASVSVAMPVVGMVTVCGPAAMPYAPVAATVTLTARSAAGAGLAVSVKVALPPSVTAFPADSVTAGVSGGGASSSRTVTLPDAGSPTV